MEAMMLRVAICDDEVALCSELEEMIRKYEMINRISFQVYTFSDGSELYEYMKKGNQIDLVFLDIEMGGMDGIQVSEKIRIEMNNYQTMIIYISAKDRYDRKLFDFQPLHFLAKPINKNKVFSDLDLVVKLVKKTNMIFSYKYQGMDNGIPSSEILYFEGDKRLIWIVTENQRYKFYGKITSVLKELPTENFIQIHRSYIVNFQYVIKYSKENVMMANQKYLPISKNRRDAIYEKQLEMIKERSLCN